MHFKNNIDEMRTAPAVELSATRYLTPLIVVVVFLLFTIGLTFLFGPSLLSLLVALSLTICAAPFITRGREHLFISPVYITLAYLALAYPIKFIAVVAGFDYVIEEYPGVLHDEALMTHTFIVFIAGLAAYLIGYYHSPRKLVNWFRSLNFPFSAKPKDSWPVSILIVAAVGWGIVVLQILLRTWSSFAGLGENWSNQTNQLFSYLFQYVWFAYIAAALWLFSKRNRKSHVGLLTCGLIMMGTFVASMILLGSKTWLVYPVYWLVISAYMAGRRPRIWIASLLILLAIGFTFPYVSEYRSNYLAQAGATPNIGTGVLDVTNETLINFKQSGLEVQRLAGLFLTRLGGIDNAAQVISLFPSVYDYFYFSDWALLPISIIPRVILPSKPSPKSGTFYSIRVAGMIYGGSAAPHPVAEGYLNLGILGVILLFWLIGLIQSLLFHGIYLPRSDDYLVMVLYAFYMLQVVGFGGWFTGFILGLPQQLIVLIPLILILKNHSGVAPILPDTVLT